jgi:hypothetical protein
MTKGQDTVILPLLKDCPNQEKLMAKLENLCSNGLRTLVCAEAILPIEVGEISFVSFHDLFVMLCV